MSQNQKKDSTQGPDDRYIALGVSLGLLFGAALGIIIWIVADQFIFFPIFVGAGLSIGVAVGAGYAQTKQQG